EDEYNESNYKNTNNNEIKEWLDVWFNKKSRAGYIILSNLQGFEKLIGHNNKYEILKYTRKEDWYLSLNAFSVNQHMINRSRRTEFLKQIRTLGIDIDQYKLDLTFDDVIDEVDRLVEKGDIPAPNLILMSRGVQLFYVIDGGASPRMFWLTSYITHRIISKLKSVGADFNNLDAARVMRMPKTINSRNGAIVEPYEYNNTPFKLSELAAYVDDDFDYRKSKKSNKKKNKLVEISNSAKGRLFKLNNARLNDISRLIKLRKGDMTNLRNHTYFVYAYHKSLLVDNYESVRDVVMNELEGIYSREDDDLDEDEIEKTINSAYQSARRFLSHFKKNKGNRGYVNDGIVRPYKTNKFLDIFQITEKEQEHMQTLKSECIKKVEKHEKRMQRLRKQGIKSRDEYLSEMSKHTNDLKEQVNQLKADGYKVAEIADMIKKSVPYIYKLLSKK